MVFVDPRIEHGNSLASAARAHTPGRGRADQRIADIHNQFGDLAFRQGAWEAARRHWRTSLDLGRRVRDWYQLLIILDALTGLATLLAAEGDAERAIELLALVRRAVTIDRGIEARVEHLLADLGADLPPGQFAAAQARGRALELETTLLDILAESES